MDRYDNGEDMNVFDILQKTNYFISYNFSDDKHAEVFVSWKNISYLIRWDEKSQSVLSDYKDIQISCPRYSAASMVFAIFNDILTEYKYPINYVFYHLEGNIAKTFYFDICQDDEEIQKTMDLQYVTENLIKNGLQRSDVELAKNFNFYPGLKAVSDYILNTEEELDAE